MKKRESICTLILAGAILIVTSRISLAAFVTVTQSAALNGQHSYSVGVSSLQSPGFIIAPDGTQQSFFFSVVNLSLADLNARFGGTWTIKSQFSSVQDITFVLPPVPVQPVPTIISPMDGATLGTKFSVEWALPDGITSGGRGVVWNRTNIDSVSAAFVGDERKALLTVNLGAHSSGQLTLRAGSSTFLPLTSSPPPSQFVEGVTGVIRWLSPPITVTVVPEPSSMAFAAFGIAGLAAWGYRRRTINR